MARAIFGMEYDVTGEVIVNGQKMKTLKDRLDVKLGYISKNRDTESLFNQASIEDNICITCYPKIAPKNFVTPGKKHKFADEQAKMLKVKMQNVDQEVGALSGGNKQKVALSKWLACDTDIFIMDSPTRGIDVGVKAVIYNLMEELKKSGKSMIIVSEELLELIGMADRRSFGTADDIRRQKGERKTEENDYLPGTLCRIDFSDSSSDDSYRGRCDCTGKSKTGNGTVHYYDTVKCWSCICYEYGNAGFICRCKHLYLLLYDCEGQSD